MHHYKITNMIIYLFQDSKCGLRGCDQPQEIVLVVWDP